MTRTVLHVAQPADAGVPRVLLDLAADQAARGWRVVVAAPAASEAAAGAGAAGARHVPWEATRAPGPSVAREVRALLGVVRATAPDVVHLHAAKAGLAGRLALRGRRPTVVQPHAWSFEAVTGPVRAGSLAWERAAARWTDLVVCVSEQERRTGEAAGVHAAFRVVPNGVDLDRFAEAAEGEREAERARLGLPDGPLAVVVGRLAPQKGQDVLLDAWPEVRERVPGAGLVLVGDGPDRPALEARQVEGVRFAGKRPDPRAWLVAADVVVLPSRWEGMSLSLLEAMACGRPVVATDVAGMREAVGDEAGAVVPVASAPALARAVAERLADPGRASAEGQAGRRRVVERHDVRRTCAQVAAAYDDVVAASG